MTIRFDVSGTALQEIEIFDGVNLSEEEIVKGLRNGTMLTSTWHEGRETDALITMVGGEPLARIVSQEIDGEYLDYESV